MQKIGRLVGHFDSRYYTLAPNYPTYLIKSSFFSCCEFLLRAFLEPFDYNLIYFLILFLSLWYYILSLFINNIILVIKIVVVNKSSFTFDISKKSSKYLLCNNLNILLIMRLSTSMTSNKILINFDFSCVFNKKVNVFKLWSPKVI